MKTALYITLFLLLTSMVNKPCRLTNTVILSDTEFISDSHDSTKTTLAILNKFTPSIMQLLSLDSTISYGEFANYDDNNRQLVVGDFIEEGKVIAVETQLEHESIRFYTLVNTEWQSCGAEKIKLRHPHTFISFQDFDGDNKNEVMINTSFNMNGNTWNEIYYQSPESGIIHHAGNFNTIYEINSQHRTIEEFYSGSWYMDNSKTIYRWAGEKLVPDKQVVLALKKTDMVSDARFILYYENPTYDSDSLLLKFKKTYNENNKKQNDLWENFFENY